GGRGGLYLALPLFRLVVPHGPRSGRQASTVRARPEADRRWRVGHRLRWILKKERQMAGKLPSLTCTLACALSLGVLGSCADPFRTPNATPQGTGGGTPPPSGGTGGSGGGAVTPPPGGSGGPVTPPPGGSGG